MDDNRHPIPQNVTGFQFKLIGEMTIKQFAYLAVNIALAYFIYLLPVYLLFKLPFILFFALLGVLLAFVPYQGRTFDRWIINFFKAVFSSNQYVYKAHQPPESQQSVVTAKPPPPNTIPIPAPTPVSVKPEPPPTPPAIPEIPHPPTPPPPTYRARTLSQEVAPSMGIPSIPQVPNLLSGIVKDNKGNTLPNILVEVKDEKENIVRVFRTNKLGQFSAATQLADGAYILELEDPRGQFKFDKVTLTLEGKIILPLEIKNLEPREELRRKIFFNP